MGGTTISFIVIGRDEAQHISNCLKSIYNTIEQNDIFNYEVIYIDSNSRDESINIVKTFINTKIYKISGKINSAIARNLGAEKSNGEILVFIDGDMEIDPESFNTMFFSDGKLKNKILNMLMMKSFSIGLKKIAESFEKRAIGLFKSA